MAAKKVWNGGKSILTRVIYDDFWQLNTIINIASNNTMWLKFEELPLSPLLTAHSFTV